MTLDWETTRKMLAESLGLSEDDLGASKQEEETDNRIPEDLFEEFDLSSEAAFINQDIEEPEVLIDEMDIIESEFEEDVFE